MPMAMRTEMRTETWMIPEDRRPEERQPEDRRPEERSPEGRRPEDRRPEDRRSELSGPLNQCTAVALLPPPEHVVRRAVPGEPPEAGYVLCELAERHTGEHAALLWDVDASREGVWVRWHGSGERARLAGLAWCTATDARSGDACGLFTGHPSAHDFDVVDPTLVETDAHLDGHPDPAGGP